MELRVGYPRKMCDGFVRGVNTERPESGCPYLCVFLHVCPYTIFKILPRFQQTSFCAAAGVFCPRTLGLPC